MPDPLMSLRELVDFAGEQIDSQTDVVLPNGKAWILTVRPFMALIAQRTKSKGGDPNRASRAIQWAYAERGRGTCADLLRRPDFGPEFAALIPCAPAECADTGSAPQNDPTRFAPATDRLGQAVRKELDRAVTETQLLERAVADERVEAVRRERADELRHCQDHLYSVIDAEAAAVSEAESLRCQLAERQAVVAAFEARVQALEASQHECRAAEARERESRVRAEAAAARSDADCRAAVARAEEAETQAERWRSVAEQTAANAELRVKDVERLCNERIAEVRSLYERFTPTSPRDGSREAPNSTPARARQPSRRKEAV